MTHETVLPDVAILSTRKPAAWVLRGDARTVERARKSRLAIHARRE